MSQYSCGPGFMSKAECSSWASGDFSWQLKTFPVTGEEEKLRILRVSILRLGNVASPPPRWRFLAQLSPASHVNGALLMSPTGLHRDDCWAIIDSGSAQWKFTELPDMVNFP